MKIATYLITGLATGMALQSPAEEKQQGTIATPGKSERGNEFYQRLWRHGESARGGSLPSSG